VNDTRFLLHVNKYTTNKQSGAIVTSPVTGMSHGTMKLDFINVVYYRYCTMLLYIQCIKKV